MKVLTVFGPGKMAGAEKVVSVGTNAIHNLKPDIDLKLVLIRENSQPQFVDEFVETLNSKERAIQINSTSPLDFKLLFNLRKSISEHQPEIIHTHGYKALIYSFFATLFLGKARIIHTHHGNTGHTLKVKMNERLALILMRFCYRVVSVSPKMTEELKSLVFFNVTEITNMFSLKSATTSSPIEPIKNGKANFLYLGRLSQEKNPQTLIEAFKEIRAKNEPIALHIVGDGPLLETLRKEYENLEDLTFYGHKKNVQDFIQQCEYLCLPSLTEGMPMTAIESLCLGTPLIANNVGALPYMVNQDNSFLIPLEDHTRWDGTINFDSLKGAWVSRLNQAMKQDKKTYTMETKEEQLKRYSIEEWSRKIEALYKSLLN